VGYERGATKDMRELVEFDMDSERKVLQFPSISGYRKDFQHRAAKSISGLESEAQGLEGGKYAVVTKY
jgi:hypothetical protein